MWPKVEQALTGKRAGETVELMLSPDKGSGQPDPSRILKQRIDHVPPRFRGVGSKPQFQNEQSDVKEMVVSEVADVMVTIDNIDLFAGKTFSLVVKVPGIHGLSA